MQRSIFEFKLFLKRVLQFLIKKSECQLSIHALLQPFNNQRNIRNNLANILKNTFIFQYDLTSNISELLIYGSRLKYGSIESIAQENKFSIHFILHIHKFEERNFFHTHKHTRKRSLKNVYHHTQRTESSPSTRLVL